MAQSQQQYPSQRPYSPPAASPGAQQQYGQLPPNKRQRLSPNPPSQPGSPYVQSPYGMSPNTPGSSAASPHFQHVQLPSGAYNTPYTNGSNGAHAHTPMSMTMPQSNQQHQYNQQQHAQSPLGFPNSNHSGQHPTYNSFAAPPMPTPHGIMGPPSKPVEKPKEDGIDPMDVLGGTGIDLREEEQYSFSMYNKSFDSQVTNSQSGTISSGHSYSQFPPGNEASFYGAGPFNAAPEKLNAKTQDEAHKEVADKAWYAAAHVLATSRQRELDNPFLVVHELQKRIEKCTREHGISMNMDPKGTMGYFKLPDQFPNREIRVTTTMGPDAAFVRTDGTFVPLASQLVDQVALLSIATKHRVRGMLEDASKLAKERQTGSHGAIPEEWADVAIPADIASSSIVLEGGLRHGWESAVSPHSSSRKRSHSSVNLPPTPAPGAKLPNEIVTALRSEATKEQAIEEARLKKRQARAAAAAGGDGAQRQGSIAPGTPGSVAPEVNEKMPTKKELKKKDQAKVSEAAMHSAANTTTAQFLGGRSMFGGKKKTYSWMSGGAASGTSTPNRINTQGLSGAAAASGPPPVEKLTVDGVRRLGVWREDKEKGRGIQMRDWTTVLEADGHAMQSLQKAWLKLDQSEPK